VIKRSRNNYL